MQQFKPGSRVEVAGDGMDFPDELGVVLWQSPEDIMLYVVLADEKLNEYDHRHRLVAADVMELIQ